MVEFYSRVDANKTTLETLNFDSSNFDVTFQVRVTNHKLAGVIGGFVLPEESFISLTDTMPGLSHSIFWLGFQENKARLANCQYGASISVARSTHQRARPTHRFLTLKPVPEADDYVLALAGLGVVGFAMNRLHRTAAWSRPERLNRRYRVVAGLGLRKRHQGSTRRSESTSPQSLDS